MIGHHDRSTSRTRQHGDNECGAALVEFALVAPLLVGLLFGIIDFGSAYSQQLDVRQGAREGSRLVAVDYTTAAATGTAQSDAIIDEICRRMDSGSSTTVALTLNGTTAVGQTATVAVSRPLSSLSGMYSFALNGKTQQSTVITRLEMIGTWATRTKSCS